jgi:hypothetical protein
MLIMCGPAKQETHQENHENVFPQHHTSGSLTFLNQGWQEEQRQRFYTTSQGSQMMPLDWFLSLERADSEQLFISDGLDRFGYLPNPKSDKNPWGLPVGFVQDPADPSPGQTPPGGRWLGMTCAACHTNRIEYSDKTMQIDGGPADADLYKFLADLSLALKATLDNEAKFTRFADRIGAKDEKARRDLRNEVIRFSGYFTSFVNGSTPPHAWGPSRTDAFGMIFNRVSAIDLAQDVKWEWFRPLEANNQPPNAPVSYPYLYNVSRLDKVQWNGVAKNSTVVERLGRNVVEVVGVFAKVNLNKPSLSFPGYPSTIAFLNQLEIEELLIKRLKSPQWPAGILPPINQEMAAKGSVLYQQLCESCHATIKRDDNSTVNVNLTPVSQIGTDPLMANNVSCRMSDTGVLAGSNIPFGAKLSNPDYVLNLATNVGGGAIIQAPFEALAALGRKSLVSGKKMTNSQYQGGASKEAIKQIQSDPAFPTLKATAGTCDATPEVYIGRPLAGIWASPPYLHNGSVPNLYQLLLPGSQRISKFKVGSRTFDPVNVGFDLAVGNFEFDTSLPGNGNKGHEGHEYGTDLSDDQRRQLVEYMKSL